MESKINNRKNFSDKEIEHINKGNVEYLKFKILDEYSDKINHCITLRHGGVSKHPYESLNFRLVGKDKKENVFQNLNRICNVINIDSNHIYKGMQAHTDNILVINNLNKDEYNFYNVSEKEYDGYVCNDKGIATLVTTADCNPIIIYDTVNNIYANIHSGWKGTVKKIYLKAIKIMESKYNSKIENLIVCIGPSIRKCCFTTEDENFTKNFTKIWGNEEEYLLFKDGKFHIDLISVIKKDLIDIGIKNENISIANICTMCSNKDFFSCRDSKKNHYDDFRNYGYNCLFMLIFVKKCAIILKEKNKNHSKNLGGRFN